MKDALGVASTQEAEAVTSKTGTHLHMSRVISQMKHSTLCISFTSIFMNANF